MEKGRAEPQFECADGLGSEKDPKVKKRSREGL
jgi:hypothetical protein